MRFKALRSAVTATPILPLFLIGGCNEQAPAHLPIYDTAHRCGGIEQKWFSAQNAPAPHLNIINRVQLTRRGEILWNEGSITQAMLQDYASLNSEMNPLPWIELGIEDGTPCDLVRMARQSLSSNCASGTCMEFSEEEWAMFHAPPPPCDADCKAYGRAGGSFKGLSEEQKARLKKNYLDKYGFIPW